MASESGAGGSGGAVGGGGAEADAHAGGRDHALGTRPLVKGGLTSQTIFGIWLTKHTLLCKMMPVNA